MLNEILKEKRKELDLTQQNVADHLNVTRQTVSSWEVGKSFPDISTLIKISDFYQLSLDLNYSYLFVRTSIYPVLIPFTTLFIVHPLGEVKKIQKEHTL